MEDLGESTQKSFQASAQTQGFLELLCWARNELIALQSTDPDPVRGLKVLVDILQCLVDFPLGLPRFFFQRVQFTRIRVKFVECFSFKIFKLFLVNYLTTTIRWPWSIQSILYGFVASGD